MKKIKRTAKKLQEEYEDIASGEKGFWGSSSKKSKIRKIAKEKANRMKEFLKE